MCELELHEGKLRVLHDQAPVRVSTPEGQRGEYLFQSDQPLQETLQDVLGPMLLNILPVVKSPNLEGRWENSAGGTKRSLRGLHVRFSYLLVSV